MNVYLQAAVFAGLIFGAIGWVFLFLPWWWERQWMREKRAAARRDESGGLGVWIGVAFVVLGVLRWLFGNGVLS